MRNEALHNGKVRRKVNILQTIKERKTNWICEILQRNCLLDYVIEDREKRKTKKRRRKLLPEDFKETRRYCELREEALYHNLLKTWCGRSYGPVAGRTM